MRKIPQKGSTMKHIKHCAAILSLVILLSTLTGCDLSANELNSNSPRPGSSSGGYDATDAPFEETELFAMEKVGSDGGFHYYRDTITDVLYVKPNGFDAGFAVMLDPETGLPLPYARYMELAGETPAE